MTKAEYIKAYRELRESGRNWHNHHMADVYSFYEAVDFRASEIPNDPVLKSYIDSRKMEYGKLGDRQREKEYSELVENKPYCFATWGKDNPYLPVPF